MNAIQERIAAIRKQSFAEPGADLPIQMCQGERIFLLAMVSTALELATNSVVASSLGKAVGSVLSAGAVKVSTDIQLQALVLRVAELERKLAAKG